MKLRSLAPYAGSVGIRVVSAGLAVAQTVILARILGPSQLGVYSALLAITTLLALPVAAGIPTYMTREIARAHARGDYELVRPMLRSGNRAAAILSLLTAVILGGLFLGGALPVNSWTEVVPLILIIPLMGWDLIRSGAMRGLNSALASQVPENIVRPLTFVVLLVVALNIFTGLSAHIAMEAYACACLIAFLFGQFFLRRRLPRSELTSKRIKIKSILRENIGLAILGGTQTLLANLDIIVLVVLGAYSVAGSYKVALQGVVLLLMVLNAIYAVAMRDLASSLASGDMQRTMRLSDRATLLSCFGTMLGWLGIVVFGQQLIVNIFGPEYLDAFLILVILGVGHLINAATGPAMEILVMFESQRDAVTANLISIVMLFASAFVANELFPVIGIALASASANGLRNFLMSRAVRKRLRFDPSIVGAIRRLRHSDSRSDGGVD